VNSIPDTVLLCDAQGMLLSTQLPRHRTTATPFAIGNGDPGHHPIVMEIIREMHAVVRDGAPTAVREFDRTMNDRDVSLEARITPAGEGRRLILLRDITARKRLERHVLANLDREKSLSEMKSQFISVASHEFRTPLAAAVGSLELLERHAAKINEAKRAELLGRIQRSLSRLTVIMNDVLQLSRADSGRIKPNRMNADLVRLAQDIVREIEIGDRQQHQFVFESTGGPETVAVDTKLTNHILSNLVSNAVRYSPVGKTVSVKLHIGEAAFTLTVADEGIGVPEEERDRIFEPFARGSNVGQINGTGLGLNIVKRYTELMGGTIELLPTTPGATFRAVIPLSQPGT
jgi:signal transduction histidine kinase